jgi:histidinol-phosphate aminotransferase
LSDPAGKGPAAGNRFLARAAAGVRELAPYVPGKPLAELEREYGVTDTLKLASNENPLGPSPASVAAARAAAADLALYPDGAAFELKAAIARHHGVDPAMVTVGNGSNELLVLLAEAFLEPGTAAVYAQFAFAVYALAVQATGADAIVVPARPPGGEQPRGHDAAALAAAVTPATRLVFVANPNNPTGTCLPRDELRALLEAIPRDVIVVVDEAYAEYVTAPDYPDTLPWLTAFPNLVITRTFSKIHGLAALRAGYAISHPDVADLLNRVRQPFNVNGVAQAAAIAALGDAGHVARSREVNAQGLRQLTEGLASLGWGVPPSVGNFVLADTGGAALPVYGALLRHGIIVRPLGNYGLPNHLRITVGLPEQNARLLAAVRALQEGTAT